MSKNLVSALVALFILVPAAVSAAGQSNISNVFFDGFHEGQVLGESTNAPACPTASGLGRGSRGGGVSALQNFLVSRGYLSSDSATGFFGRLTEGAVQRFQSDENIVSSGSAQTTGWGRVGGRTLAAMRVRCTTANAQTQGSEQGQERRSDPADIFDSWLNNSQQYNQQTTQQEQRNDGLTPTNDSSVEKLTATPRTGARPLTATFSHWSDASPNVLVLDFGDGTSAQPPACGKNAAGACVTAGQIQHTYSQTGTYIARLVAGREVTLGSVTISVPDVGSNTGDGYVPGTIPSLAQFLKKANSTDTARGASLLYGVIGSNKDLRNWTAIMSSENVFSAACQATNSMYNGNGDYRAAGATRPRDRENTTVLGAAGNFVFYKEIIPGVGDNYVLALVDGGGYQLTSAANQFVLEKLLSDYCFDRMALVQVQQQIDAKNINLTRVTSWPRGFGVVNIPTAFIDASSAQATCTISSNIPATGAATGSYTLSYTTTNGATAASLYMPFPTPIAGYAGFNPGSSGTVTIALSSPGTYTVRMDVNNNAFTGNTGYNTCTATVTITQPTQQPTGYSGGKERFFDSLYKCVLNRTGSVAEVTSWASRTESTADGVKNGFRGFFFSQELAGRNLSNNAFTTIVYKCILGRDPEANALTYWNSRLTSGTTRTQMVEDFLVTPEFTQNALPRLTAEFSAVFDVSDYDRRNLASALVALEGALKQIIDLFGN